MREKVIYTFVLKDGKEIKVTKEGYFGFVFAEGFTLKYSLNIKENKIFYKRWTDYFEFNSISDFISFIIYDFEEEKYSMDQIATMDNYKELTSIRKISDIKEIKTYLLKPDLDDPYEFEETTETISFEKFTGDF